MSAFQASAPLGSLFKTSSGGTPLKARKEYYEGGDIPWLLSGEVAQGEVWTASNFITRKGLENSSAKVFPINTVLVAMYGATAGQVGILKFEATTNQAVCGVFPSERFVPDFLYYFLLSKKDELVGKAVGNAQPNISQAKIRETLVPLVSISDQQRIVTILDEAFEGIATAKANAEKNLQNARELFTHHREALLAAQPGWREAPLAELCAIKHGYAFDGEFFSAAGEHVLLTPGSFYEAGGYRERGVKTKYFVGPIPKDFVLTEGDLLVAMTEQAAGLLGSPLLVPESHRFLHNQRLGLVVGQVGVPWSNEFFFHVFNLMRVRQEIHASASGAKVRHTSPGKIGLVRVAYPESVDEQRRVAAQLVELSEECDRLVAIYQRKLAALDELKKSLLHQAFSGQL